MDSFARRSYNFMSMDCFTRSSSTSFCLFSNTVLTKRVPRSWSLLQDSWGKVSPIEAQTTVLPVIN